MAHARQKYYEGATALGRFLGWDLTGGKPLPPERWAGIEMDKRWAARRADPVWQERPLRQRLAEYARDSAVTAMQGFADAFNPRLQESYEAELQAWKRLRRAERGGPSRSQRSPEQVAAADMDAAQRSTKRQAARQVERATEKVPLADPHASVRAAVGRAQQQVEAKKAPESPDSGAGSA